MNFQCATPLNWPVTWKRTGFPAVSGFDDHSIDRAVRQVYNEMRLLKGASTPILTANIPIRRADGWFYSDRSQPKDSGVALYFRMNNADRVLACDKWKHVEDNIWAIALHIGTVRAQSRYGVGSIDQAFAGYTALPAPGQTEADTWWRVLGCAHDAPFEVVKDVYIDLAKKAHPDAGGRHDQMVRLNIAWDQARKAFGKF